MKHLTSVAFAVAISVGIGPASSAEPTSYPLVCKGGPDMRVQVNPHNTGCTHLRDRRVQVWVKNFRWASRGAGSTPPAAGECTWLDRGGRASEPTEFLVEFPERIVIEFSGRGQIVSVTSFTPSRPHPGVNLVQDILAGRIFYLHAYSDAGVLRVTRLGP